MLFPVLQLPELVQAAEWPNTFRQATDYTLLASTVASTDGFDRFKHDLQNAPSIEVSPLSTCLVPNWLRHFHSLEAAEQNPKVEIKDSEFEDYLADLRNPSFEISSKYANVIEPITKHLQSKADKIVATLEHARRSLSSEDLNTWYDGLKGYARRLAHNARRLPAFLDAIPILSPQNPFGIAPS